MRFITCAGYYGTGSSAVTDFVSEFDEVASFGGFEFRFIHDPEGISDLEYNLVDNFNRHNSGHALKRYKWFVDFFAGDFFNKRYSVVFHENWKTISYQYIDKLTDFTFYGWWPYDLYDRGRFFYLRKRIINKILKNTIWRKKPWKSYNSMKREITYCSHPDREYFVECTRNYIEELFLSVNDSAEVFMVDQILPTTNLRRYMKYFDDIKIVIVDRDPRDVFLLAKYVWKNGNIPEEVESFCKWFIYTRKHRKYEIFDTEKVMFLQFEDLVYKYNETTDKLIKWLKLEDFPHRRKKENFNPDISIKNTKLWEKMEYEKADILYIEKNLKDYLYDYIQ